MRSGYSVSAPSASYPHDCPDSSSRRIRSCAKLHTVAGHSLVRHPPPRWEPLSRIRPCSPPRNSRLLRAQQLLSPHTPRPGRTQCACSSSSAGPLRGLQTRQKSQSAPVVEHSPAAQRRTPPHAGKSTPDCRGGNHIFTLAPSIFRWRPKPMSDDHHVFHLYRKRLANVNHSYPALLGLARLIEYRNPRILGRLVQLDHRLERLVLRPDECSEMNAC